MHGCYRLLFLLGMAAGCVSQPIGRPPQISAILGANYPGDAARDLTDDNDLADVRAEYEALDSTSKLRETWRAALAAEYWRRIESSLRSSDLAEAREISQDFTSLWTSREWRSNVAELAMTQFAARLTMARRMFAKVGDLRGSLLILYALERSSTHRQAAQRELAEISAYLFLNNLQSLETIRRSVDIYTSVAKFVPSDAAVEYAKKALLLRYEVFVRKSAGRNIDPTLWTRWATTMLYAQTYRLDAIPSASSGQVSPITPILPDDDSQAAWSDLARTLVEVGAKDGEPDLDASLAVARFAVERFPKSPGFYFMAAVAARSTRQVPLAIRYYERGLQLDPSHQDSIGELLELYDFRVGVLLSQDRSTEAKDYLQRFLRLAKRSTSKDQLDASDAYATFGRGLAGLGELPEALKYLQQSLQLRPNREAFETSGLIALRQKDFAAAQKAFAQTQNLPTTQPSDRYDQTKILRLLGEAYDGQKSHAKAKELWVKAIEQWNILDKELEMSAPFIAESWSERGKLKYLLGDKLGARKAFERAVDASSGNASTYADVVSYLVARGEFDSAIDAYHRALGNRDVSDYFKTYMSLWVVSEAVQRGEDPDFLAVDFLQSRKGSLWHDHLARYASGKLSAEELAKHANTRGKKAEMFFYMALFPRKPLDAAGLKSALENVLRSNLVLFFEYDMAQQKIAQLQNN